MASEDKRLVGDYSSNTTFTVYETKDNSGNKKFRISANDGGDGVFFLGILVLIFYVIASPYFLYKYVKRKRREAKGNFLEDDKSSKRVADSDEEIKPILKTVDLADEKNPDEELYLKAKELVSKQQFIDISKLMNLLNVSYEDSKSIIKRLQDDELISLKEEGDHGYVVYKEDLSITESMDPHLLYIQGDKDGVCGPIYRPEFDDYIFALMNVETEERRYYYIYDFKITDYPKEIVCKYIKKYYEIRLFEDEGIATCISSNSKLAKQMLNMIPDEKLELDDGIYVIYRIGKVKNN